MGGAKISDKIKLIKNLLDKVDIMIIGGAMAFPFLNLKKIKIGQSLIEDLSPALIKEIEDLA